MSVPQQISLFTPEDARRVTDEVKRDAEALWAKLNALYDGGAHLALGYSSWGAYFETEFGQSRSRGYQLLSAGRVIASVQHVGLPAPANDRQAAELAPLLDRPETLREAWAEVVELHPQPTAADVREVVQSKMGVHYSSETPEWGTPQALFDLLHGEFGFTLDVCATQGNAKCERFFTAAEDGLAQTWEGVCWMNPPYGSEIAAWMAKAHAAADAGATVVCLVPARTDTGWWWEHARYGEVRFLRGRLRFGDSDTGAPFPSALVVLGVEPCVKWWEAWPKA